MLQSLILLLLTALASSVITLLMAYMFYRRYAEPRLDRQLEEIQAEFEARVKSGVQAAAIELMPELREQVRMGFTDALAQSHTAGLMEDTAKAVSVGKDLGAGIVETGLNALFGRIKPPKR